MRPNRLQLTLLPFAFSMSGCLAGYTVNTIATSSGPPVSPAEVRVFTGSEACPGPSGAVITAKKNNVACSQEETVEKLREKAGELGYNAIQVSCVEAGLVGHQNCTCNGRPLKCN